MATIKDVAKLSGYSVAAVSKYLKNPTSVRATTKEQIEKAICELDYCPSTQARALRSGKTGMISIISPNITNPFFAELFTAIQQKASEYGYTALLQTIPDIRNEQNSIVSRAFAVSSIQRVDGIIVCFPDDETLVQQLREQWKNVPIALMSWDEEKEIPINLVVDVERGMYEAAKYLIEIGHQVIGYIGAPGNSITSKQKQKGFLHAMEEAGLLVIPELRYHASYSLETGYQAAEKFHGNSPRPTAVLTEADIFAIGFIKYCHKNNIAIPGEAAVVGFDDIPMAAMYHPPISTVQLPIREIGEKAMESLCHVLQNDSHARITASYSPRLIVRDSTSLTDTE